MTTEPPASPYLAEFGGLMKLTRTGEDRFVAPSLDRGMGRLFGGQVIAQALFAAEETVGDKAPHSLHGYFLRQGSELKPVDYTVTRNFDGRRVANRHVIASQDGRTIFTLSTSFHAGSQATDHAMPMPDVEAPENLPSREEVLGRVDKESQVPFLKSMNAQPFEMRVPESFAPTGPTSDGTVFYQWFRATGPLGDDMRIHRALISYVSDYALLGTTTKVHGLVMFRGEIMGTSLDHAIWFHQPDVRADDWLCYVTDSPWSGHGRGFARGYIFTRDGTHIASIAQEGLISLP